jgi:3-oxoacyl-[acyl-carrier protein] reductase
MSAADVPTVALSTGEKVALVTASAGAGIGSAVARRLAIDGFRVVISDLHERRCKETADRLSDEFQRTFLPVPLDVSDSAAVNSAVSEVERTLGRIDVLVNNAGWSSISPVAETSDEVWNKCLAIDLSGAFYCTRAVLPLMVRQGGGAIINMSSTAAWEATDVHGAAYSAAKAGVLALTRVAAAEYGRHGVRVNAVAPGLIYNPFLDRVYDQDFFDGYAERRTFLGRVGAPEDVANVVSFLASDQASYVTGEVYTVAGGSAPHT